MSGIPSLTLLSEEQKFNGDNLLQWKTNIIQLLASKGLLGYVEGKIPKPTQTSASSSDKDTPTTSTPIYSTTPTYDEWNFRDHLARGHITLNCTDVAGLGVITTGTSKEAWESIQNEWGKSTDMRRSHAQEALNRTIFIEGTDIQDHIKLLRTRRIAVDNLSSTQMNDETWRGIIIHSIPPTGKWLPVIPSLYAMASSSDVVSTLLAHGMILGRDTKTSSSANSHSTALAARTVDGPGCTNPLCKAKNKKTHTTPNCYWPGGGKEGQFPPNFGQRSKANAATSNTTSTSSTPTATPIPTPTSTSTSNSTPTTACASSCSHHTEHFALSALTPEFPGQSGVLIRSMPNDAPAAFITQGFKNFEKGKIPTFMDSGASDTMFVLKEAFTDYKPIAPQKGDSAKAVDGSFDIIGEGSVVQ